MKGAIVTSMRLHIPATYWTRTAPGWMASQPWHSICVGCGGAIATTEWCWRDTATRRSLHDACAAPEPVLGDGEAG